jgi:hypothetical protein
MMRFDADRSANFLNSQDHINYFALLNILPSLAPIAPMPAASIRAASYIFDNIQN